MTRDYVDPVRVLVVENASSKRNALAEALQCDGDIVVVGQPSTSADAVDLVAQTRPDAVILDLELSDGRSQLAIEQIMARTPTPILVLPAGNDDRHSPSTRQALVAGALDALSRPERWTADLGAVFRQKVRQLSKAHVIRHPRGGLRQITLRDEEPTAPRQPVVAIAASTGGPSALACLLASLVGLPAPVFVVQHMLPDFTAGFVAWMARVSGMPVELARHGQLACAGHVYVAPGGKHLRYTASGRVELSTTPDTAHRPSADELFRSVAEVAGSAAVGVLLTGMGDDGANGLLTIRRQGGLTLAQDEESSAIFGMPKAAHRLGAVTALVPLDKLATAIQRAVNEVVRT